MKSSPDSNRLFGLLTLIIIIMVIVSAGTYAQSPESLFEKGNKHYMDQAYSEAAAAYEQVIASGKVSAEVYFNLGNAHYKMGNLAQAILSYERARRLSPSDPDILYNLRMANLNTIDKIEPLPQLFYERWWHDFVTNGSVTIRSAWALGLLWMALGVFAVYLFTFHVALRKAAFFSSILLCAAALFTWYLTHMQHRFLNNKKDAVIFTESAYVKSSPDEKSANLFLLHSGTRIEVLDNLQGWRKIRIANGNEGWIDTDALEVI
jgi:tetratricopeptide (TPR) repeat protein